MVKPADRDTTAGDRDARDITDAAEGAAREAAGASVRKDAADGVSKEHAEASARDAAHDAAQDAAGEVAADAEVSATGEHPADTAERVAVAAADNAAHEAVEGSLFDPATENDEDNPYGEPGAPVSRFSAVYRGFWMTIGVALAVALVLAVDQATSVLVLILIAAFLAVGLNPIVEFLIRRNVKRKWAVLIVAVLMLGIITLVVSVVVGVLRDQIVSFFEDLPSLLGDLKKHKSIAHLDAKYGVITDLQKKLNDPNFAEKTFGGIFNVGLGVLNALASTVIVIILTLYFLSALPQIKRAMFSLAPASRRERVTQLGDEILRRVGRYVIGAFVVALMAGTVTTLFLICVGLGEYALPLALGVALLDLIPLVGSITGAAVVVVVCLANSLDVGIAALIFYVVYETIEGYVIYPRVMRSSVDVPEYVTIVAVLLGGAVGGVLGALLALPMAAAILLIGREVWVRRQDVT